LRSENATKANMPKTRSKRRALERHSAEHFVLAGDLLCTASLDGRLHRINPAWTRALGHAEAELLSVPYLSFVHPDDRDATAAEMRRLADGEDETASFENRFRAADGSYHQLEWTAKAGRWGGVIHATARDVTEYRRTLEASRLLASIARSSDDAIVGTTLSGTVTSWSHAAERIYGYSSEEMIGRQIDRLVPPHREGENVAILAEVFSSRERVARVETERLAKDGSLIPVALTTSPIRDESGTLVGLSSISRDVTERKALEAEIDYLHRRDELTGLYSRREFEHELRRQLPGTRRYGSGGAILVLDLDDLAWINVSLGRHARDELLVHVARLLTDRLRAIDTVARLTADRFGVLLPEADEEGARTVARDLLDRVRSRPARLAGRKRRITCSIGIARFDNTHVHTVGRLIATADLAVEDAKRQGGNRAVLGDGPRIRLA
jgi:diguanylate cyclase (GGDEF)-like protein/PAS domain S-box-containing protein